MAKARVKGSTVESSEEIAADGTKKGKRGRPPREGARERASARPRGERGEVIHVYCEPTSEAEKALFCAMGFLSETAGIPGSRQAKLALIPWVKTANTGNLSVLSLFPVHETLVQVLPKWTESEHAKKPPILHVYCSEGDDDGERDRMLFAEVTRLYHDYGVPKSRQIKAALSRWLPLQLQSFVPAGEKPKG